MQLQQGDALACHISSNHGGGSYFSTEEVPDVGVMASVKGFLQEFKEIELEKEIPVAIMVYDSGMSMRGYSPDDYFDQSAFEGMDVVRVATIRFSATE